MGTVFILCFLLVCNSCAHEAHLKALNSTLKDVSGLDLGYFVSDLAPEEIPVDLPPVEEWFIIRTVLVHKQLWQPSAIQASTPTPSFIQYPKQDPDQEAVQHKAMNYGLHVLNIRGLDDNEFCHRAFNDFKEGCSAAGFQSQTLNARK